MGCCLISFVWIALFPVAIPMKEQLLGRRPNTITLAKVFFPVDQPTQKNKFKTKHDEYNFNTTAMVNVFLVYHQTQWFDIEILVLLIIVDIFSYS